jgi:hypothetical protein
LFENGHYYKDLLGFIYTDTTTGCLDICIFRTYTKLPGVDIFTFRELKVDTSFGSVGDKIISSDYAKDKKSVYFGRDLVTGADASSFTALGQFTGKDKNNVYFLGKKIAGADTSTFKFLDRGLGQDDKIIYFEGVPITEYVKTKFGYSLDPESPIQVLSYEPAFYLVLKQNNKYYLYKHNPQPMEFHEISQEKALSYPKAKWLLTNTN